MKSLNVVLRFSSLGDIVLTSGFVRNLKGPTLYVTSAPFKDFVKEFFEHPSLDVYKTHRSYGFWGWIYQGYTFANFLKHYTPPYECDEIHIYDLHNVGKSLFFKLGLRFGLRQHFRKSRVKISNSPKNRIERYALLIFKKSLQSPIKHVFEKHASLLDESEIEHPIHPALKTVAKSSNFRAGNNNIKILIAPEAQHWKKVWPKEYWIQLLSKLWSIKSLNVQCTLVTQKKFFNDNDLDKIHSLKNDHSFVNLQAQTDLMQLPQIAASNDLCISGNSAWLHLSEATQTPALSLAGPIVETFGFSPWLAESTELSVPLKCRPCTLHGDGVCFRFKEKHHACMREITADRVFRTIWRQFSFGSPPE